MGHKDQLAYDNRFSSENLFFSNAVSKIMTVPSGTSLVQPVSGIMTWDSRSPNTDEIGIGETKLDLLPFLPAKVPQELGPGTVVD